MEQKTTKNEGLSEANYFTRGSLLQRPINVAHKRGPKLISFSFFGGMKRWLVRRSLTSNRKQETMRDSPIFLGLLLNSVGTDGLEGMSHFFGFERKKAYRGWAVTIFSISLVLVFPSFSFSCARGARQYFPTGKTSFTLAF